MLTLTVPEHSIHPTKAERPAAQSIKAVVDNTDAFMPSSRRRPDSAVNLPQVLALVGTLLGDTGGCISPKDVPAGFALFNVQYDFFFIDNTGERQYIDIGVQTQCLPLNAALSERDIRIINTMVFSLLDVVGNINAPLDEDDIEGVMQIYRDENITPELGAVGWSVYLTPKR